MEQRVAVLASRMYRRVVIERQLDASGSDRQLTSIRRARPEVSQTERGFSDRRGIDDKQGRPAKRHADEKP